jgi:hypothetical protein
LDLNGRGGLEAGGCSEVGDVTDSPVLVRVRGASLAAALLLVATVTRREADDLSRFNPGRVVFVPLAVRVVVDPSAFLI